MQDKYQQGLLFKMSTSSTESSSVRKLDKETFSDIDLSKVRLVAAWADFLDCHQAGDLKFVPHAVIVSRGAGIPSSQTGRSASPSQPSSALPSSQDATPTRRPPDSPPPIIRLDQSSSSLDGQIGYVRT
jgi:hypothetical protein